MKLIKYLNKKIMIFYIILAIFMSFDNLVLPMTIENIIKDTEASNFERLKLTIIISIVVWTISKIMCYLYEITKHNLSRNYQTTIKSKLYSAYMYSSINSESFQNMLYKDINLIEEGYLNSIFGIVVSILLSSVSLIYMFQLDFHLSMVFIGMTFLPIMISGVFDNKIISLGEIASKNNEKYIKNINENIRGLPILKHYQRVAYFKNLNSKILDNLEKSNFDKKEILSRVGMILKILYGASYIIPIGYGAYRIIQGQSTIAALMAIYLVADKAISPLTGILEYFNTMKSVKTIKDKLLDLLEKSDKLDKVDIDAQSIDIEKISFNKVGIGYDKELFNITDNIDRNEKILIIGESGSGKSSLFKTIFKEIPSLSGSVEINDKNIELIEKQNLYKSIGYIPQDIIIFDESVKFNIDLGETFSEEQIKAVLKKSGFKNYDLDKFLLKNAGKSGKNLSGGEKARICIARALIRGYDILLVDEFSAALDKNIAKEIRNLLMNMDITILEIAHHFDNSDLELFDKIYEIKNGVLSVNVLK